MKNGIKLLIMTTAFIFVCINFSYSFLMLLNIMALENPTGLDILVGIYHSGCILFLPIAIVMLVFDIVEG